VQAGVFEPIALTPPVDTKLPFVRPFTYGSPSDYRLGGPLELSSRRYVRDVAEVQEVGRVDRKPIAASATPYSMTNQFIPCAGTFTGNAIV
jgi:hypothetical protein